MSAELDIQKINEINQSFARRGQDKAKQLT